MTKFFIDWEMDTSWTLEDPKERAKRALRLLGAVKADLKHGLTEWGAFPGGDGGYAVFEGDSTELALLIDKYIPYVLFTIHPVASVEEVTKTFEALAKQAG